MDAAGRWLIVLGIALLVAGLALIGAAKLGIPLGRLPGDVAIERDGFRFYLPLGTCIAVSLVLSLVLWALAKLR
jgi:hypothetical protein